MRITDFRGLSVAGPFGLVLATGVKPIELRSWLTYWRGMTFFHVSQSKDYDHHFKNLDIHPTQCPKSSIVGAGRLVEVITYSTEELWERDRGLHLWAGDETYQEVREDYYGGKPPIGHRFEDAILFDAPVLNVPGARFYWAPTKPDQIEGFEQGMQAIAQIKAKQAPDPAESPSPEAQEAP